MFGEVWRWAGKWRQGTTNLGVAPHQIGTELHKLEGDLEFWLDRASDMPRLEVLTRFHHRAVWIHPFNNGNGRWSRLATDAVAVRRYKADYLIWANDTDTRRDPDAPERRAYVAAVQAGDIGNFDPLMAYLRTRNPEV